MGNDQVFLRLDGAMMNAAIGVNGSLAALEHYGYAPFEADIANHIYPGEKNRIFITFNPGMQPNSRWHSGAGRRGGREARLPDQRQGNCERKMASIQPMDRRILSISESVDEFGTITANSLKGSKA